MPSDTPQACICGRNYSMTEDQHSIDCPAGINYPAWIKHQALTPTASEATAIGAGEAHVIETAQRLAARMGCVFVPNCSEIPNSSVAASPKVASDTAPGAEARRLARTAFALEVSQIDRDALLIGLTDDEIDSIIDGVLSVAALAASPTASDTDTAIPGGEVHPRDKQLASLLRREGRHSGVWFSHRLLDAADRIEALSAAASPKPDTDTPVDPGVEGVREAELRGYYEGRRDAALAIAKTVDREVERAHERLEEFSALAAKPIAGMDVNDDQRERIEAMIKLADDFNEQSGDGALHIIVADGNVSDDDIHFCRAQPNLTDDEREFLDRLEYWPEGIRGGAYELAYYSAAKPIAGMDAGEVGAKP